MPSKKKENEAPVFEHVYPTVRMFGGPHKRVSHDFSQGGLTQQNFKEECDINRIMKRFLETNTLPNVNPLLPQFADVTGLDFREAMELTVAASDLFNTLPSALRERFQHNPGLFLDYINDQNNYKEMATLGLLTPEASARILNPAPASAPGVPGASSGAPGAPLNTPKP